MSIDSSTSRVDYIGNGNSDTFSYNFKIFHQSALKVIKRENGVEVPLDLNVDYEVDGVGLPTGGTIRLINGNLPQGSALTIRRVVDVVQETDIRTQSELTRESLEDALDYQTMISQGQQDDLDRSVKVPETIGTGFNPKLPTSITLAKNKSLIINSQGTGFDFGLSTLELQGFYDGAREAEAEAQSHASAALTSKNLSEQYKTISESFAASAQRSKEDAQAAHSGALIALSETQTAQSATLNAASAAQTSKNQAAQASTEAQSASSLAKNWATKMGETVDGSDYSAKHYSENAQSYRVKFYDENKLVGFVTELNFDSTLQVTTTPSGRMNVGVQQIVYQPTPYGITVTAEHIAAGEISLPQAPPYPDWVRLVPEGGIEQVNGVDYKVVVSEMGATLSWKNLGLDGVLENNERILLIY